MPKSNEEKILISIDGTLKDILKELKKSNRLQVRPSPAVTVESKQ